MMLVRPSARARTRLAYKTYLRTPQREDAAPKSPEARRQFTRTEPSPEGVRGTMRPRGARNARNERQTGALRRRADAAARETRRIQFARALASQRPPSRERPPRGAGQGRTISPSLSLAPPLSVDRRRGAPSSSSKRSARVQLCWDITPGAAAAAAAATYIQRITVPAFPRLVDDPRAVGPNGPWRRPGAAGRPSRTLAAGLPLRGGAAGPQPGSHVQHDGPRQGPSATPQKTGFERHELNSCVGGAKS